MYFIVTLKPTINIALIGFFIQTPENLKKTGIFRYKHIEDKLLGCPRSNCRFFHTN